MKQLICVILGIGLAGCVVQDSQEAMPPVPEVSAVDGQVRPQARPTGGVAQATRPPPSTARTVEDFDTTTSQERAAAAAPPPQSETRALGQTVASLGDVTQPGFWLETPLVDRVTPGRVAVPGGGSAAQVELRPIDGPTTAGSRISLAAMRLLNVPLTDLPVLEVFADG